MATMVGEVEITVRLDAATAALVMIRDLASRGESSGQDRHLLDRVHALADAALKKAQPKPRIRHA